MKRQSDEEVLAIIDGYLEILPDEYDPDEEEEEYHERLKGDW